MKQMKSRDLIALVVAFTVVAGGCSVLSPQEDRSRYFVLMPVAASDSLSSSDVASSGRPLTVGLGPITIPHYLERPEVVTRLNDTELALSDTDRWGEPLDASVSRILAQDLSSDLPTIQILAFPWSKRTQIDYRISVDFRHLERMADGKVEVQAAWTVRSGIDNKLV